MTSDLSLPELRGVAYSPITDRPRIRWPGGARVAFWIALNVESYELIPPEHPHSTIYGRGVPVPDVLTYSMLEYGNRVGFWRTLERLDRWRVPVSVSLSMGVFDEHPEITAEILARDWSILSHGIYNTRFLYGMPLEEERRWIQANVDAMREHTGRPLRGMFGPAISLSPNSMDVWAQAGISYVVDLFMDDQPFPVRTPSGTLVDVPYSFELNDGLVMGSMPGRGGKWESDYFVDICKAQFDTLYREGATDGRVMCISLHPFVIGHPARISALDEILDHISRHDDVWMTTAEEIADHYREHYCEEALAWQLTPRKGASHDVR